MVHKIIEHNTENIGCIVDFQNADYCKVETILTHIQCIKNVY